MASAGVVSLSTAVRYRIQADLTARIELETDRVALDGRSLLPTCTQVGVGRPVVRQALARPEYDRQEQGKQLKKKRQQSSASDNLCCLPILSFQALAV